ncbi:unnamed protein product [Rotaria sp. Silwood2]|nr:unnamed protein product [Rotaria sp. Silwood2]CAF2492299.1 unnamed protein product [Rotaria sp. Silwood2]CAF2722387.1 unnamed protein product [Rotaria sp. Silwood2]CAF2874984.1 unnamed protein product [Rotaria sp. Silwood2]CAF3884325.1 unnamed protein product [Rotaria sp. Silwood2]
MSSTRTAPRTTNINKTTSTLNTHHTNGSSNSYDINDSTVNVNNMSETDSNVQRSVLTKNTSQSEGIYRNPRFVHAITIGLLGQPVIIQTTERERFHGVLETISPNGDVVLSVAHRLDNNNNNNDIMGLSTALIDLFDAVDSSLQSFELNKRIIPSTNIVEIIAGDIDLSGSGKCMLDENPKVTQLEDERFNRMEHFYGTHEIDPDTLEDLDLGDDGKAGYDAEDMFHTNREKFNTTTDFDESKYTNVPIRQMTADELAEIEKKVSEIEKGSRNDDIDEDDAGVKRPSEYNQTHNIDDGNSNTKNNQSSRSHTSDRRSDFRYDAEYNTSKRGNWREQRTGGGGGGNNRRGGGGGSNNYSMNNPKPNQRSEQTQYTSSRSSEQSANNRQQQYKSRNNRFTDSRSPHEGRDSPLQITNDETTRGQRINSGSFSQGQNSGPTSPSTVPARTIYSTNNRPPIGRNSPAPYTGSSSSRNNSTTTTSPSPTTAAVATSHQTNSTGAGNYSHQSNNKMAKKQLRNEQQSTTDESDQPKQQRNQQQTSSNNQSSAVPLNRPSQLHTQQIRQQQQQQIPSSNNNIPPPLTLPTQEDHSSSHESVNPNQSDQTIHITNAPVYTQHTTGTITPGNVKTNSGLNPEADEFVPVFSRESSSRPESRGATSSMPSNTFISHAHPQALHLLQQQQQQQVQQTQVQQSSMIPPTHPQNAAALYQQYYQPSYTNMAQFVTPTPQQMNVNMMGTQMMPPQTQQQLTGNGPNTNTTGTGGMTTPSGSSGPTYKTNNNSVHSGDTGSTGVNNVAPKKAVVSVQRGEQSNAPQQQQVTGAPQMVYSTPSIRYYQPDYMAQQATPASMQLQQIPFYYPINTSGIIQAAAAAASGVGPPQNIMIPSTSSSAGPATSAPHSIYYPGVYSDPRMYGVYPSAASVNPGGVNPNWQLNRSPPHQQQQQQPTDQQRAYVGGQNVLSQVPPPTGAPNTGGGGSGRSASTSGPSGQAGASSAGPSMTSQYALNGGVPATYAYGSPAAWYSTQAQVPSPQTNMPPQVNAYGMMFDPSQQAPPQQPTYVHPSPYDAAYFQQSQQQLTQQGLDTVPPGNYNR